MLRQRADMNTSPIEPPAVTAIRMTMGHWVAQCISVAGELRIPDLVASGPRTAAELASRCGAARFRRIVDVGGGQGLLLAAILRRHPSAQGVLFDLPQVVEQAKEVLQGAGVADRCELVGGDFFQEVPSGGDAYVLKVVLHDWDDERARRILSNCRKAMGEDGRLLVVERVIPERLEPTFVDQRG